MKKIIIALFIGIISVYANSVQVFKTNTMHLQVDSNTKLEKLFVGTMQEYTQRQKEILSSQTIKSAVGESAVTMFRTNASNLGEIAKSGGTSGGLIGAGLILGMTAVMGATNYITQDFSYLYLAKGTNADNQETLIYSLIISNNKLENEEIEKLAIEKIKG